MDSATLSKQAYSNRGCSQRLECMLLCLRFFVLYAVGKDGRYDTQIIPPATYYCTPEIGAFNRVR
jgi:hypothetical protein